MEDEIIIFKSIPELKKYLRETATKMFDVSDDSLQEMGKFSDDYDWTHALIVLLNTLREEPLCQ